MFTYRILLNRIKKRLFSLFYSSYKWTGLTLSISVNVPSARAALTGRTAHYREIGLSGAVRHDRRGVGIHA